MQPVQCAEEKLMISGQCNCGAVAFTVTDASQTNTQPGGIFICHCSLCRRSTGSNGIAVIVVDNHNFRWVRGEEHICTWRKPVGDWQIWFCRVCGSPLPGVNDPARMFVPAGLISSGADELRVAHHIWVDSKAPWDRIGDDGHQHPAAYVG